MNTGYVPRLSLNGVDPSFQAGLTGHARKLQMMPATEAQGPSFQDALGSLVQNLNQTTAAPDALMRDAMTTGNVDVHDVMIANAKAELAVNITAQVATKVIQAYDKILQIQI